VRRNDELGVRVLIHRSNAPWRKPNRSSESKFRHATRGALGIRRSDPIPFCVHRGKLRPEHPKRPGFAEPPDTRCTHPNDEPLAGCIPKVRGFAR
jgi:hypothetical protein